MKAYEVRFYLEEAQDDNPVWAVVQTPDGEDAEQTARFVLARDYDVNERELVWLATSEYFEEPDLYLSEHPIHPCVWT